MGGAGMLGYEIVRQLVAAGKARARAGPFASSRPQRDRRVEAMIGDIRSARGRRSRLRGHGRGFPNRRRRVGRAHPARTYDEVNVAGNRNVIEACRRLGVPRLVYTSSMDVVVDGRKPIVDGDESLPYPARMPRDPYSRSKILAERMVLAANGEELATCSLRPVGMYGPRDKYHLGNIIAMARKGVSLRLGNGSARFSHAYSENVAHAHVLARARLRPGAGAAGQSYFICDHFPADEPLRFHGAVPARAGSARAPALHPVSACLCAGRVAEVVAPHSNFNRFAVIQTCVDHTFVASQGGARAGLSPHRFPGGCLQSERAVASERGERDACRSARSARAVHRAPAASKTVSRMIRGFAFVARTKAPTRIGAENRV